MDGMESGGEKDFLILSLQKTNSQEMRLPGVCIFKTQTPVFCLLSSFFFFSYSGGLNSTFQPFLHMIQTPPFLDYVRDLSTDHVLVMSIHRQCLNRERLYKDMKCFNQVHFVLWLVAFFSF